MKKYVFCATIIFMSLQANATNQPTNSIVIGDGSYVCLTSNQGEASMQLMNEDLSSYFTFYAMNKSGISCERARSLEALVGATALSVDGTALALACTGIGLPYAVKLQTVGLGLHVLEFIIGNVPCDNSSEEEEIQRKINSSVCQALEANGIHCDPNLLSVNQSGV